MANRVPKLEENLLLPRTIVRRQAGRQVGGDGEQAAAAGDGIDHAGQEDGRQDDQEDVQRGFHQAEGARHAGLALAEMVVPEMELHQRPQAVGWFSRFCRCSPIMVCTYG